jgi:gliding motility-associated-like protein
MSYYLQLFIFACYAGFALPEAAAQAVRPFHTQNPFQDNVFIENNGQFVSRFHPEDKVHYAITNSGELFQFSSRGVEVLTSSSRSKKEVTLKGEKTTDQVEASSRRNLGHFSFVQMHWLGADTTVMPQAQRKKAHAVTYLRKNETGEHTPIRAAAFEKIVYRNIYPGIDVEYTIPEKGGVKYTFVVHPGADPTQIRLQYTGEISSMRLLPDGAFEISTPDGFVREEAPVSYTADEHPVNSAFRLDGNTLRFVFPNGYDSTQTLLIDPWVVTNLTNLSTSQNGYDVRMDNFGNLFVYGGGDPTGLNVPPYQVAKYDQTGNLLWTFNGVVASQSWSSVGQLAYAPSNMLVDRITGKTYIGQAYNNSGAQIVRLDPMGNYDNFITVQSTFFEEIWDFVFDCNVNQVYAMGGGTTSNINFGVVNSVTGAVASSNITGTASGAGEDAVNVTTDPAGNVYCIFACSVNPVVDNHIFKVNSTFNGFVWTAPTGYFTLNEGNNRPFLPNTTFFSGNGHNCLAADNTYLYYYDGFNLKAFNSTTGAPAGTTTTFPGYTPLHQGGIAVDNCGNIYLGGAGQIHIYQFNGSTFSSTGTISLGATLGTAHVYDIRYNTANQTLYVSGEDFVGVYSATASVNCSSISVFVSADCSGTAVAGVLTTVSNPMITYTWYDSNGNVVGSSTSTNLTDTITGLTQSGNYMVFAQVNGLCGGPLAIDTFSMNILPINVGPVNPVSCFGLSDGSATTTVVSGNPPFTYVWNTTPPQSTPTASNLPAGTYLCTISDTLGCTNTVTITITQPPLLTAASAGATVLCSGASTTLVATPTGGTAPYTIVWTPGGPGSSITVTPATNTVYQYQVTDSSGCTYADSVTVTVLDAGVAGFVASPGGCTPWPVTFTDQSTASGSAVVTSWLWDFGDGNTSTVQNPQHTYTTAGVYTVSLVITFSNGCSATLTQPGLVSISASPVAAFAFTELSGGLIQFTDQSTNAATWQWDFGDGGTSTVQNPSHTFLVGDTSYYTTTLIVTSPNGCTDTAEWRIEVRDFVIYIPNTFTPNGDGDNDGFTAYGIGIATFDMMVFDRWGMLLYQTNDINRMWDGTFKGNVVQMDTYVYKIRVRDVFGRQHEYIGHVNVVR